MILHRFRFLFRGTLNLYAPVVSVILCLTIGCSGMGPSSIYPMTSDGESIAPPPCVSDVCQGGDARGERECAICCCVVDSAYMQPCLRGSLSDNDHGLCLDCVAKIATYDLKNDHLNYQCPICRTDLSIEQISTHPLLVDFKRVLESFDFVQLQELFDKDDQVGPLCCSWDIPSITL